MTWRSRGACTDRREKLVRTQTSAGCEAHGRTLIGRLRRPADDDVDRKQRIFGTARVHGAGFALEAFAELRIRCNVRGQDFDRDIATKASVSCSIDFSNSARANERADLVCAETGAGRKRHRVSVRVGRSYPLSVGEAEADQLDEDPITKCVQPANTSSSSSGRLTAASSRARFASSMSYASKACSQFPLARLRSRARPSLSASISARSSYSRPSRRPQPERSYRGSS